MSLQIKFRINRLTILRITKLAVHHTLCDMVRLRRRLKLVAGSWLTLPIFGLRAQAARLPVKIIPRHLVFYAKARHPVVDIRRITISPGDTRQDCFTFVNSQTHLLKRGNSIFGNARQFTIGNHLNRWVTSCPLEQKTRNALIQHIALVHRT